MKAARLSKIVRVGSLRLELRAYADGRFGFDYVPPGECRVKVRAVSLEKAEARALEILGAARGGKVERLAIDEAEYAEFLRWKAERSKGCRVGEIVERFLETRREAGCSGPHVRRLTSDLRKFTSAFTGNLAEIARHDADAWLRSLTISPRSRNNVRDSILAVYRFARREGLLGVNICGFEQTSRLRCTPEIATYTPAELSALLAVVEHEWLPLVLFGAFAGLRAEEIHPPLQDKKPGLLWENILWTRGVIDVPATVSKTRKRRFVPILPTLAQWLAQWHGQRGPVTPRKWFTNRTAVWRQRSGVEWRKNGLRHSFASYRLALTKDAPALAIEMGNSPAMIFRHYAEAKHEDEALEWFAIVPKSAKRQPPKSPDGC